MREIKLLERTMNGMLTASPNRISQKLPSEAPAIARILSTDIVISATTMYQMACQKRFGAGTSSCGALASSRCALDRSTELMEIISIDELRGAAPGTIIMVATRRKHGNERPSIISSSVMTS